MAKFNVNENKIITYEGGQAFVRNPAKTWINFIFSSFLQNSYYKNSSDKIARFIELTNYMRAAYGDEFVAKAAVMARNEIGVRSVSQLAAAILNDSKMENKRAFFRNFCHRIDDVAEIFAATDMLGQKKSHAMIRGCGDYLSNASVYSLGKYKMKNKKYNLFDIINITHANSQAINDYKNDNLAIPETWEVKISAAKTDGEKANIWFDLVNDGKLGYLALLRNLNNILKVIYIFNNNKSDYLINQIVNQLIDINKIRKSLVFPYQIYVAYKNLEVQNLKIVMALNEAFATSTVNIPEIEGNNTIILDVSGSMFCNASDHSTITMCELGAVYAVALFLKTRNVQLIKFGSTAKECDYKRYDNPFNLIDKFISNDRCGNGTNIIPALSLINKEVDNIFIFSDMQIMEEYSYSGGANEMIHSFVEDGTHVFSFDLCTYNHTFMSDDVRIHYITGLNDSILKMINILREDENAIVNHINSVKYF